MTNKWLWIGIAILAVLLLGIMVGWWVAGTLGGGGVVGGIATYIRREQKRRQEDREIDKKTDAKIEKIDKQEETDLAGSQTQFTRDADVPTNDDAANSKLDTMAEDYERTRNS